MTTKLASPLARAGAPLKDARAGVVMVHGRGASAEGILSLADAFETDDIAYVAPQAPGHTWYPHSFLAPIDANEPYLSRSLAEVGQAVDELEKSGIPRERIMLLGFSQGGCLALEYAARNAGKYAGVVGLSAGLIGPPGTPRDYSGSMSGTPIFLGCSDIDSHIPVERVHESSAAFANLDARVVERIYPDMGHTIVEDEVEYVRSLLRAIPPR
jgi:phospholipase/carboxylesterase